MPIVRNIDVTMHSEVSFDDACRAAVAEAAKTLRGIMSFRVKEAECVVERDRSSPLSRHRQDRFLGRTVADTHRVSATASAAAPSAMRATVSTSTACGQRSCGRWNQGLLPTRVT